MLKRSGAIKKVYVDSLHIYIHYAIDIVTLNQSISQRTNEENRKKNRIPTFIDNIV